MESQRYTIFIELDPFADLARYPDGVAYTSGVIDSNGEMVDGQGDIATYEEARELALLTLANLLKHGN